MVEIVDHRGQPLEREALTTPQTSRIAQLHREFAGHPARGLTPSRLAQILDTAEQGDLLAQYELFEDMEEKDPHILAEMSKRRRALVSLDWDVVPPPNASAAEKKAAEACKELLQDMGDFEEVLFDLTDAIGKGFACLEIEWAFEEKRHLPANLTYRPQTWFRLHRGAMRQEIRLRDNSADGEPLWAFGWLVHEHKAKSGYLERAALFRALVWPYLFKNYSVGDLAEFLEIYGIPVRLGKYHAQATEKEKLTLLRALSSIGHNASGIIPEGMSLEFLDAATGDPKAFELMIDWCERSQSKAILGATLTSQADRGSNTNALGNIHNEVRKDLREGDAKQAARTITRDLLYPMAALNHGCASVRRAPRFQFDLGEAEDLKLFALSLPRLVEVGLQIPEAWAREQLRIPAPAAGEAVLLAPRRSAPAADADEDAGTEKAALRARTALRQLPASGDRVDELVELLTDHIDQPASDLVDQVRQLVDEADSLEALRDGLLQLAPGLPGTVFEIAMQEALTLAALAGMSDARDESLA